MSPSHVKRVRSQMAVPGACVRGMELRRMVLHVYRAQVRHLVSDSVMVCAPRRFLPSCETSWPPREGQCGRRPSETPACGSHLACHLPTSTYKYCLFGSGAESVARVRLSKYRASPALRGLRLP